MAKRDEYLANIRRKLSAFMVEVGMNNQVNRQNINISGEDVSCGLLNLVFDWELINTNGLDQNFPAIDLVDWEEAVAVQVTSDTTSTKIKKTLAKVCTYNLAGKLKKVIVLLLKEKPDYTTEFPHDGFELEILDLYDISKLVERLPVKKLGQISAYLDEELGSLFDTAPKAEPKHLLPGVPAPSASFVEDSRNRELEELKERLSPDAPIFLWGVGGIGKTEVAIQLARKFAPPEGAYFLHYYDMPGEGDALRETILRADFTDYRYQGADTDNRDHEYKERMDILRTEYPGALLIIDNFDRTGKTLADLQAEPAYRELTAMDIRLVFTTRSRVKGGYEIKPLDEQFLLTLMEDNLDGMPVTEDEMRELIKAVEGHTLMVVLMARTLARSYGNLKPADILTALKESRINSTSFRKVENEHNPANPQARIYDHMKALFALSNMNKLEKDVLRWATLLPENGMDAGLFQSCMDDDHQDTMGFLIDRGWLTRGEMNLLTIHPVIREVCRGELDPTDKNCSDFLERLWRRFDLDREYHARIFLQISRCFSVAAEKLDDAQCSWHHHAGRFWTIVGRYQEAYPYRLRVMEYCEQNCAQNQLELANACREFGSTCSHIGETKKAFDNKRRALTILQKIQPPPYEELAQAYYSMGFAYSDNGDHRRALEYKRMAVSIREEHLPRNRLGLARAYNNLGSTYGKLEDHSKALQYKEMALKIRLEELPSDHPDLAISYSNVGVTYAKLRKYDEALEYHMKARTIREASLLDTHLYKAISCYHIGDIYEKKKEYALALRFFREELEIQEKTFSENHPAVKKTKRRINSILQKMQKLGLISGDTLSDN